MKQIDWGNMAELGITKINLQSYFLSYVKSLGHLLAEKGKELQPSCCF